MACAIPPSRRTLSTRGLLLVILLLAGGGARRAFAVDSLAGTYKGATVVLSLQAAGDQLGGMIKVADGVYPVVAKQSGSELTGSFTSQGHTFGFTASLAGDTLTLKSGQNTYELIREVVNPLDRPPNDKPVVPPSDAAKPAAPPDPGARDPNPPTPGPIASAVPTPAAASVGPAAMQATTAPVASRRARHATQTPTRGERIAAAIQKGKTWLYARQHDGNWEELPQRKGLEELASPQGGQWGGFTSLATYALLAAGEKPQDPRMAQALTFLRGADIVGTYALGLRAQVWQFVPQPLTKEYRTAALRDAHFLIDGCHTQGDAIGFYHYLSNDDGYDHSASQYGVLGMWACQQVGIEVPGNYWKAVEDAWRRDQDKSGGWNYHPRVEDPKMRKTTVAMTAAGVASLFITQDYLHSNDGVECKGNIDNPNLTAGLKWMSENFPMLTRETDWFAYSLYGVSRIGVASGYKYFGTQDWFARGADLLLAAQGDDGAFGSFEDTCFAVLFLVRGRAPVAINKLEYTLDGPRTEKKPGNWNQRPRDVAHVTRWLSHEVENDLNWQIVNLDVPIDELHDAPILYIAGNQVLSFTAAQEAKLRQFVEEGGLILGNADCGGIGFTTSFRKLAKTLFPAYDMKEVPRDASAFQYPFPRAKWKSPLGLQSVSNGARDLMLLVPLNDPARFWQTGASGGHEESHQFLADLYLWISDRANPRYKGETHVVRPDPKIIPTRSLKLARLQYAGNWDPEPAGWRRTAAVLRNDSQLGLEVTPVKLGDGRLSGYKVAHLTGTGAVKLTAAQHKELKAFVDGGGTLVVDSCGGNGAFATAIEGELSATFGAAAAALQPLPAGHPVYTAADLKPEEIKYRAFARRSLGQMKGSRLRGMTVNGRVAVFYSPEDLSVGLVGQPLDGVFGYEPQTATDLMTAILLYAAGK